MRRPLLSTLAVAALLAAPHAFGCSPDEDDLEDIADDTTLHVRRTGERDGGDTFVMTLDVDGVKKGSSTSEPDCPEITATFAVDGADSAAASRQGGVSHSTSEGCRGNRVDNYSCRALRFET
ncbi:MAG TPA: hypothetical protein VLT33_14060, partial [Labilithrix sp.]|nr:hypothetical protein [Labilithrix sp.]